MSFVWKLWVAAAVLAAPLAGVAATCTSQAEIPSQDREMISSVALRLSGAIAQQDYPALQAALAPAEAGAWNGIRQAAEQASPLLAGGTLRVRNIYVLDASMQTAPADTDFFCANPSGTLDVTISMHALPPGKFAVVLTDASGAKMAGQLGLILAWDNGWKLGGLSAHEGMFDGHDGVWYWSRARSLIHADPWSAWYSYDVARYLLVPVNFLMSPNLEKLNQEQQQIQPPPEKAFPLSLTQGDRTWKVDAVDLDTVLHQADLAVVYQSTGVTDPAAQRTEATSVLSLLLKAQPGLRANFHGLWAVGEHNGVRTPVMELPMDQIPQK